MTRRRRGFGLIDVLAALGVAALTAALAAQTMSSARRVWERAADQSARLDASAVLLARWRMLVERAGAKDATGGGVIGDGQNLTLALRSPAYPDPPGWAVAKVAVERIGGVGSQAEAVRWGRRRIGSRASAAAIVAAEATRLHASPDGASASDAWPGPISAPRHGSGVEAFDRPLWRGPERWRLRYYGADRPHAAPRWWRTWPPHTVLSGEAPGAGAPLLLALLRSNDAASPPDAGWFAAPAARLAGLCAAAPADAACRKDPDAPRLNAPHLIAPHLNAPHLNAPLESAPLGSAP